MAERIRVTLLLGGRKDERSLRNIHFRFPERALEALTSVPVEPEKPPGTFPQPRQLVIILSPWRQGRNFLGTPLAI
jgi:hypothetical protein